MKKRTRHFGLSLVELLIVMAVMTLLMTISVPAVKAIIESFDSTTSVRQLINAALSSARAIAIKEQTYAGIRFQQDKAENTYMVFIIHDPDATPGLPNGFRAVTGRSPMKLPKNTTVTSSVYRTTIIFSPQGKLTIHGLRVRNKDGRTDDSSADNVFNTQANVDAGRAMFVQDIGGIGNDVLSVQKFLLNDEEENISPYTGELVLEYRDKK